MTEFKYQLEIINPQQFFGPNNRHFELIKKKFPKLKIIARGHEIKVFGEESQWVEFQTSMQVLEKLYTRLGELTELNIQEALDVSELGENIPQGPNEVLLIGTRGQKITARTRNQRKMLEASASNDILFAIGPAGTGKTYRLISRAKAYARIGIPLHKIGYFAFSRKAAGEAKRMNQGEMIRLIKDIGEKPAKRNTAYEVLERF